MKKQLLFVLALLCTLAAGAQTVTGDRVVVRQSLYHKDIWLDSTRRDTANNFASDAGSLLTPLAMNKWLRGNAIPQTFTNSVKAYISARATGAANNTILLFNNRPYGDTLAPGLASSYSTAPYSGTSMMGFNRYWYADAASDTVSQQYGSILNLTNRWTFSNKGDSRFDSATTNGRSVAAGYTGIYTVNQLYAPKSLRFYIGAFGWSGASHVGNLGIGGPDSSFRITMYGADKTAGYQTIPMPIFQGDLDLNRAAPNTARREIRGMRGISPFVSHWKSHQTGALVANLGSYIEQVHDFFAVGPIYLSPFGTTSYTKAQILATSKVDTASGLTIAEHWLPYNEVANGYGVKQEGYYDVNDFRGPVLIGPRSTVGSIADTTRSLYVDGMGKKTIVLNNASTLSLQSHRYTGSADGSLSGAPTGTAYSSISFTPAAVDMYAAYTMSGQSPYSQLTMRGNRVGFIFYPTFDNGATWAGYANTIEMRDSSIYWSIGTATARFQTTKPFSWATAGTQMFGRDATSGVWRNVPITTTSDGSKVLFQSTMILPASTAPASSADAGTDGEVKRDAAGNLFIYYSGLGWLKFAGAAF